MTPARGAYASQPLHQSRAAPTRRPYRGYDYADEAAAAAAAAAEDMQYHSDIDELADWNPRLPRGASAATAATPTKANTTRKVKDVELVDPRTGQSVTAAHSDVIKSRARYDAPGGSETVKAQRTFHALTADGHRVGLTLHSRGPYDAALKAANRLVPAGHKHFMLLEHSNKKIYEYKADRVKLDESERTPFQRAHNQHHKVILTSLGERQLDWTRDRFPMAPHPVRAAVASRGISPPMPPAPFGSASLLRPRPSSSPSPARASPPLPHSQTVFAPRGPYYPSRRPE
jgi:hypothetical protein